METTRKNLSRTQKLVNDKGTDIERSIMDTLRSINADMEKQAENLKLITEKVFGNEDDIQTNAKWLKVIKEEVVKDD